MASNPIPIKDPTWYRPVCDVVEAKIKHWFDFYERGEESGSRPWITMNGRIVDRITRYAHKLAFKPFEVDHLVRLLDALAEHPELADDFRTVRKCLANGQPIRNGEYIVTLNFAKADVLEILNVLIRARTGKLKTIEQITTEQTAAGKGIFES